MITLAMSARSVHFFDAESGAAIGMARTTSSRSR
jgi:hypothetical protein